MADNFDPDQYLAAPAAPSFNPDSYLGKPAAPEVSQGRAALEGALSGVSGNMRDEVYGASKASGLPDWLGGFRAPIGAARLAYEHFMDSPGDATKEYERARDEIRAIQKRAKELYPGTSLAGEIGGALAVPGGAAMQAATLPGRMLRGAAVGAGYGGLSGFGAGEGAADSAKGAAIGAPLGAGVGALAPPLVEGAIQAGGKLVEPISNAVKAAINPEKEAARRVVTAVDRDFKADPSAASRLTPQEFLASQQEGLPTSIMDMGGESTRALARSAANTSPEGRVALTQATNDRFEGQSPRVIDWLNKTFHYPNAQAQQQAIDKVEQTVNRAGYQKAYKEGDKPIFSPQLELLTSSPDVAQAMKTAAVRGQGRAVTEGYGGFNAGVNVSDSGVVSFPTKNGVTAYPNLQFWDYTKRALGDMESAARRSGKNDEASVLKSLRTSLTNELDSAVPSYQQARAGAAHFFGAENALEAGQNFVTAKMGNREAREAMSKMTPDQKQLFQDGYVSKFIESLGEVGDRRNVLNSIAQSPAARERLNMVLGPQKAKEMEAMLRVEGIMDLPRTAIQGNSTTARQLAELGLAGGASGIGGMGIYDMDPKKMGAAAVLGALAGGKHVVDQRLAKRVAQMLVSDNPAVLAQGVRAVAHNDKFLNAMRDTDVRLATVGAQKVPAIPMGLGTSPVHADQQQQP